LAFYQNILINKTPKIISKLSNSYEPDLAVVPLPIGGFSLKPIFKDWNIVDFPLILVNNLVNYKFCKDHYKIASFTFNPDGSFKPISRE